MELCHATILRDNITESHQGINLQGYITEFDYGIILRNYIMGLYYGIMLRNDIAGSYYGIISRQDIMEFYMTESSFEKDPGGCLGRPGAPWDPGDPLGTPLGPQGTQLGFPRDVPETPPGRRWDLRNLQGPFMAYKNNISRQIHSARSSRLLCSNLLVGTRRLKDSPGPFCL